MRFLISNGHQKSTSTFPESERFDYWRECVCEEYVYLDCKKLGSAGFQGELRGGVGISTLRFSEVVSNPQVVTRSRKQIARCLEADFLISFQMANCGVVRQDGREALLTPGMFALYDSTRPYTLEFSEDFHQFVIQMPKDVLAQHLINPEKYTAIPISADSGLGAILRNFVFSLVGELHHLGDVPNDLSDNLVQMIAMAFSSSVLLEGLAANTVAQDALRKRVRSYISNNLCDPQLNNLRIAEAQGISPRYLHKLFEHEHESIHSLIVRRRLEKARQYLVDPAYFGHSIERIAYRVGFISSSHFSNAFKRMYDCTPSEARFLASEKRS